MQINSINCRRNLFHLVSLSHLFTRLFGEDQILDNYQLILGYIQNTVLFKIQHQMKNKCLNEESKRIFVYIGIIRCGLLLLMLQLYITFVVTLFVLLNSILKILVYKKINTIVYCYVAALYVYLLIHLYLFASSYSSYVLLFAIIIIIITTSNNRIDIAKHFFFFFYLTLLITDLISQLASKAKNIIYV